MGRYRAKFKRHAKWDIRIQNIKIERAYRVGIKKRSPCRSIVAKLSSFKIKECILKEAKKRKPTGIQIYEDFSKVTVEIRKKN